MSERIMPAVLKCPVCGFISDARETGDHSVVDVRVRPYEGMFCLRCFGKWLAANFPRMEMLMGDEKP